MPGPALFFQSTPHWPRLARSAEREGVQWMSSYERWLQAEKKWIGEYQKEIMTTIFLRVLPVSLVLTCALFGAMSCSEGEGVLTGVTAGALEMIVIALICLLFLLPAFCPGRYVGKIRSAVKNLGMDDREKEQLGREMLSACEEGWSCISCGAEKYGGGRMPVRFRITPHYAFLEGSRPYAVLVRLADVEKIVSEEGEGTCVPDGIRGGDCESAGLYTICFFRKERPEVEGLPVQTMEFYGREARDKVMDLIKKQISI